MLLASYPDGWFLGKLINCSVFLAWIRWTCDFFGWVCDGLDDLLLVLLKSQTAVGKNANMPFIGVIYAIYILALALKAGRWFWLWPTQFRLLIYYSFQRCVVWMTTMYTRILANWCCQGKIRSNWQDRQAEHHCLFWAACFISIT